MARHSEFIEKFKLTPKESSLEITLDLLLVILFPGINGLIPLFPAVFFILTIRASQFIWSSAISHQSSILWAWDQGTPSINSNLAQLKVKFHSKSELLALLQLMVYKMKAQQQAELAEVLFISMLETGDHSDHSLDTDPEDDEEWQPLNDQADDVLETIAMRTLGFVESMSGSGC